MIKTHIFLSIEEEIKKKKYMLGNKIEIRNDSQSIFLIESCLFLR